MGSALECRLDAVLKARLNALEAAGLRRYERIWPDWGTSPGEAIVACSNLYLGDPAGFGAGASRLVSGTRTAHREFEKELAAWQATADALLFNSGFHANSGVIPALVGAGDAVFSDALNHASIVDGVRLARAERHVYPHANVAALEEALAACDVRGLKLVVTESLFSMDGDLAPLEEILDTAERHEAVVMVDEAHAIGVLGGEGRGAVHALGLHDRVAVRVGTCGKAMAGFGAFVCGSSVLREFLFNRARTFVFTTALPADVVEADRAALRRLQDGAGQTRLWRVIDELAVGLAAAGWWRGAPQGPVFPILVGDNRDTVALAAALERRGFFVQAIRPPTVPPGTSRLRLTASSDYDSAFVAALVEALVESAAELGITPRTPA